MTGSVRQHQSHENLLTHFDARRVVQGALDAIIVPNGRPTPYLKHAIGAARECDVPLLLLCSKRADASTAALAAKRAGVRALALDTDMLPAGLVPAFETDRLLRADRFSRRNDTSFKRNLGLLLAMLAGWERIVFLDDDIMLPRPEDLVAAAGLLDDYPVVGLANAGMPDNSVVCHALRDAGLEQDTFIGGGALAVGEAAFGSFFPNIYNEDWFFLLDGASLRPSAVTGTAIQDTYDPYRDARRARSEELGDTLAEGVFALLDNGLDLPNADQDYWRSFLPGRRHIIQDTIGKVEASPIAPAQKARMIAALKAAIGRSLLITPELCVRYLHRWQNDCLRWRSHLRELRREHPAVCGIEGALGTLDITYSTQPGSDGRVRLGAGRRSFFD
jgi:hypothetical protein